MFKTQERFIEYYKQIGMKIEVYKGILWVEYQRMIQPLGPAKLDYSISKEEAEYLLSKFPDSFLIRYTMGFNTTPVSNEWYAVIQDNFLDLDDIPSGNSRSKIRRGLRNCHVSLIDANLVADKGYEVYITAFERYKDARRPQITEEKFKRNVEITKDFEDIIDYWGVFHQDKLIAYATVYKFDSIEADYSVIKFHPDYLKLYPSYALFYTMNKYYLEEKRFEYVNDGFRNILHRTNIQDFLIEKFKFKKRYVNLNIIYKPWFRYLLYTTFPARYLLERLSPKLQALYKLEEIRRIYDGANK